MNFQKVVALRKQLLSRRAPIEEIPTLDPVSAKDTVEKDLGAQFSDQESGSGDEQVDQHINGNQEGQGQDQDEGQKQKEIEGKGQEKEKPQSHANTKFARALGSTDWRTREKGLEALKQWLQLKKDISENDMNKLWKGLFYCHWHSDKSLVQAELAYRLSKIFLDLGTHEKTQFIYFQSFCFIMRREWFGIDKIRMDKFLMLVRYFFNAVFSYFSQVNWDEKIVSKYVNFIESQILLDRTILTAKGFSNQIYDVFVDEIAKGVLNGAGKRPRKETWSQLLTPFINIMITCRYTDSKRVSESIFQEIFAKFEHQRDQNDDDSSNASNVLKNSVDGSNNLNHDNFQKNECDDKNQTEKNLENGDLAGKKRKSADGNQQNGDITQDGENFVVNQKDRWVFELLDFYWLGEWLFDAGSDKSVEQTNREILYDLSGQAERVAKKFKRLKIQNDSGNQNELKSEVESETEKIVLDEDENKVKRFGENAVQNGVKNNRNNNKNKKKQKIQDMSIEKSKNVVNVNQNGNLNKIENNDEIQSGWLQKVEDSNQGENFGKQSRSLKRRIAKLQKLKVLKKISKNPSKKKVQKQQQQIVDSLEFENEQEKKQQQKQQFQSLVKQVQNSKKISNRQKGEKHLRWSMKKNLVHKFGEPAPPEDVRSPPGTKPKGSALRKPYF